MMTKVFVAIQASALPRNRMRPPIFHAFGKAKIGAQAALRELEQQGWKTLPMAKVVPSENDRYFRKQVVKGYVHDMGAAMLGGVSGHAGLFSDAEGLAVILQMLLQGGYFYFSLSFPLSSLPLCLSSTVRVHPRFVNL